MPSADKMGKDYNPIVLGEGRNKVKTKIVCNLSVIQKIILLNLFFISSVFRVLLQPTHP